MEPEDTGEVEYERLLEAAYNSTRKYWRARGRLIPKDLVIGGPLAA
jgi:hypothetical protein